MEFIDDLVGRLRSNSRSETSKKQEHSEQEQTKDEQFASSRSVLAKFGPSQTTLSNIFPEHVGTKLVVDKAGQGDTVAEGLEEGDWVAEKHHRRKNKENILEHAGEGEDEGRGLADLRCVSASTDYIVLSYLPGTRQTRSGGMQSWHWQGE